MQEQLTFEEYLKRYVPNCKTYPCNGYNDPYQDWNYNWIMSGHAEKERLDYLKSEEESLMIAANRKKEYNEIRMKVIDETGINEIKEGIALLGCSHLYEEFIEMLIKSHKNYLEVEKSKANVRLLIMEKYHKEET